MILLVSILLAIVVFAIVWAAISTWDDLIER